MTVGALITAVKTKIYTDLPALLVTAGLLAFDEYTEEYLANPRKRILAVYCAESMESEDEASDVILIQAQMPGTVTLKPYIDVIWEYIKTLDANYFGFQTLKKIQVIDYPGDFGSGGAGAFLFFELDFYKRKDSCD